jgi:hypothetical protein
MKLVKDTNNNIIAGTEAAYQKDEKTFKDKWQDHKTNYMGKHTTKEMVYENGSALALLYREVQRLNQLLTTKLQSDEQK